MPQIIMFTNAVSISNNCPKIVTFIDVIYIITYYC